VCRRDQRRKIEIETDHVEEIPPEANYLDHNQPDVRPAVDKKFGPSPDANSADDVENENAGQKESEIEPLIASYPLIQAITRFARAVALAVANQARRS